MPHNCVWQPCITRPECQIRKDLILGVVITLDGGESFAVVDMATARILLDIPGCPFREELLPLATPCG